MDGRWMLLPLAAFFLTGCSKESAGPEQHDTQSIDRDRSEFVHTTLDLSGGTMRVAGGADKLVSADFRYGANASKPEVHYDSSGGRGHLTIKQSGSSSTLSHTSKDWDLRLNNDVPMEVEIQLGGGEARLNLGALNLRNLEVQMGAGELDLDLRGTPKNGYPAHVQGGAGQATIHLPSNVGLEVEATGGLGEINTKGLRKDGARYVNDALGKSNVTIHLNVQGGVGEINLLAD